MKRNYLILWGVLLLIACLSGILTSGISFAGRVGINTFYTSFKFFKVWWQSGLVCLGMQLAIAALLYITDSKCTGYKRLGLLSVFLLFFLTGLYLTYSNFRADLSHRWLGERFHLGVYLYWLGFCFIDLFFMTTPHPANPSSENDLTAAQN